MNKSINVAVVRADNCASSLLQGIDYYRNHATGRTAGLLHEQVGGYRIHDIRPVAAFDVDRRKVGTPLHEAVFASPNCTTVFQRELSEDGVVVQMGPVLDGVAEHMGNYTPEAHSFRVADVEPCDVARVLRETQADVLVCYLPVGSQEAARYYARACLEAGVAMVNCIPVFRTLARLMGDRGVRLLRTYQLNIGGNTDFLNMLERSRLESKRISKTESVQSQLDEPLPPENIHIGPSDYVAWQRDNKVCLLRMEWEGFGGVPMNLELRMSVEDSPNSAGVAIDAIRCAKLALDRKIGGPLVEVSACSMKHPPQQMRDIDAKRALETWIRGA
jgi:myo-inositol-1-phosphate synthase